MSADLSLVQQRTLFTQQLAALITWASTKPGYTVALNEVLRSPEQAAANAAVGKGIANSLHLQGLAADLALYIYGVYQTSTAAYMELGQKWKSMNPLNCWGGDFHSRPDGNHFSSTRDGIR